MATATKKKPAKPTAGKAPTKPKVTGKPKPTASKPKPKGSLASRAGSDRGLLKRALKDPGLRSKLPDKLLPPALRETRRLNQPITPGSLMTERQLATASTAAGTEKWGAAEGAAQRSVADEQQTARDTGGYYDDYQAKLMEHARQVQAFQTGAQQALAGTAAGITGLAGNDAASTQAQANQGAALQGVTPAANLVPQANAATATRQALMGSFQAQQGITGAANNTYADARANVVAPAAKIQAMGAADARVRTARDKLTDIESQKGATSQAYSSETRASEAKNVAAIALATDKNALEQQKIINDKKQADAKIKSDTNRDRAKVKADAAKARAGRKVDYAKIRADRKKAVDKGVADANKALDKRNGGGPFAGLTERQIRALSPAEQQKKIDAFKKKSGKGGKGANGKGPEWKTSEATSRGMSQLKTLKNYADKAKRGDAFVPGHQRSGALSRNGPNSASSKIQSSVAAPDDPILVTAALDAAYDGSLSAATVRKLIAAGYKPSRVMATLGVSTSRRSRGTGGARAYSKGGGRPD